VYSFGSNGQVSFEEDIIRRAGCEVHVFDPTMDDISIQKVEAVRGAVPTNYLQCLEYPQSTYNVKMNASLMLERLPILILYIRPTLLLSAITKQKNKLLSICCEVSPSPHTHTLTLSPGVQ
jgi:hypothetical protein